jgi:hypothetical protein
LFERLARLEREAESILRTAKRKGETRAAVAAVAELRQQIEAVARIAAVGAMRVRETVGPTTIEVNVSSEGFNGPMHLPAASEEIGDEEVF